MSLWETCMSSYTIPRNKLIGIIVVIVLTGIAGGLIGYYAGVIKGIHESTNIGLNYIESSNNIELLADTDILCSEAPDFALATTDMIWAHLWFDSLGASKDVIDDIYASQKYFAYKTYTMLDLAYQWASEVKVNNKDIQAKVDLLKTKISEMKQLASELKTIAYKYDLSNSDYDQAWSIYKNMRDRSDDIHNLAKEIINEMLNEMRPR